MSKLIKVNENLILAYNPDAREGVVFDWNSRYGAVACVAKDWHLNKIEVKDFVFRTAPKLT